MTTRREFEAGLGRWVLWVLVYGALSSVTFVAADWLLGVLGRQGLGWTAAGVLVAILVGWVGANALERAWRRRKPAGAAES